MMHDIGIALLTISFITIFLDLAAAKDNDDVPAWSMTIAIIITIAGMYLTIKG